MSRSSAVADGLTSLMLACVLVGCDSLGLVLDLPASLPSLIKAVQENPATFVAPVSGPAVTTAPGEVVDALELTGCWGMSAPDYDHALESVPRVDYLSAVHFDAGGGFEWWDIISTLGSSVLVARRGTFEVLGADRIRVTETEEVWYDAFTGQFDTNPSIPPVVTDYVATRVGDVLAMWVADSVVDGQPSADDRDKLVLQAFECP